MGANSCGPTGAYFFCEKTTLNCSGKHDLHTRWVAYKIDGTCTGDAKEHELHVGADAVEEIGVINQNSQQGQHRLQLSEKRGELCMLAIATTVNQEGGTVAAVIQEISWDPYGIVLSSTKLPHPIVSPPFARWISHTCGKVGSPEVYDSVEVIGEVLTRQFDGHSG